jgi:hypothetical protein
MWRQGWRIDDGGWRALYTVESSVARAIEGKNTGTRGARPSSGDERRCGDRAPRLQENRGDRAPRLVFGDAGNQAQAEGGELEGEHGDE